MAKKSSQTTPAAEHPDEARRRYQRSYIERRATRTAGSSRGRKQKRRAWTISEAKTAVDLSLTVPEAALQIGRTASAVESLRKRWRRGALPAALAMQIPSPPQRQPPNTGR